MMGCFVGVMMMVVVGVCVMVVRKRVVVCW